MPHIRPLPADRTADEWGQRAVLDGQPGGGEVDAVASVTARIGAIHARMASLVPLATPTATSTATSATAASSVLGTATFDQFLAAATTAAGVTGAGSALNADGVPVDLAAYGNGRIPESVLSPVAGSSERIWAPAAESLNRLLADAAAQGVTIGVTDGYRDYDSQVRVAQEKGLYSQGGLAAEPGTSQHGWGLAVDLRLDATAQAWMRTHGAAYGFHETVAREPWHWEFTPTS